MAYKESGIDKASELISSLTPLVTGAQNKTPPPGGGMIPSFDKGGTVKKTGLALVHKGEKVIPNPNMSLHRALSHLNKGGLHRALNVPEGEKIPADKLAAARNSKSEHVRHMANFAHTLEGFKK